MTRSKEALRGEDGPSVESLEAVQTSSNFGRVAGRVILVAGALLAGAFVLLRLDSGLSYQGRINADNIGLLLGAVLLTAVSVIGCAVVWARLLGGLAGEIEQTPAVRAFVYTWLGRYVPGTVPYHAARIMLADSLGTSKRLLTASIAYESILTVGSGALVGVVGLMFGLGLHFGHSWLYVAAGAPLALLPLALHPRVLVPVTDRLLRIVRRPGLSSEALLDGQRTTLLFLAYSLIYVANGLGFYLVTQALGEHVNPALAVGAFNLAAVLGVLTLFVPSGVGVREAVIVALLSSTLAPDAALVAAGLARVVALLADVATPLTFFVFDVAKRVRSPRPRAASTSQVGVYGED